MIGKNLYNRRIHHHATHQNQTSQLINNRSYHQSRPCSMGNQPSLWVVPEQILRDIPGFVFQSFLGKVRFLKTLKCVHTDGPVVVKVYLKPNPGIDLSPYSARLKGERLRWPNRSNTKTILNAKTIYTYITYTEILVRCNMIENPNIFPFQQFRDYGRAAFLIRQFFSHNLYDRLR